MGDVNMGGGGGMGGGYIGEGDVVMGDGGNVNLTVSDFWASGNTAGFGALAHKLGKVPVLALEV